ncbi:hypothetical protein PIB30_102892, partial [Stylosanthes scabra]|nr:hypothetical protein [Stylosanthes scabra]
EAGPAPPSGSEFEVGRNPNPGDFPSSVFNRVLFFYNTPILSSITLVTWAAFKVLSEIEVAGAKLGENGCFRGVVT